MAHTRAVDWECEVSVHTQCMYRETGACRHEAHFQMLINREAHSKRYTQKYKFQRTNSSIPASTNVHLSAGKCII